MGRPKIRILLADDQPEMLEAVRRLLEDEFDIVAAVENGEDAIKAVESLNPDILVLDISMPVLNGLEAASRLQSSASGAKVIFLTVHEDIDFVEAAFLAGALGYVLKGRLTIELIPAIREALQGHVFCPLLSLKKEETASAKGDLDLKNASN
jgi:DNA-binding NarL/FixJ family response regulator